MLVHTGYHPDESLHRELQAGEPDFSVLGHKSYGRNANFLLETGYAQVAEAIAQLARALEPATT